MKRIKLALSCMMLLMLYIGPSLFAMSSCAVPIPAEQNMTKDFALATEYETSNQSITSFAETLDDDVLFYPDGALVNSAFPAQVGDDGQDDWIDSTTNTGVGVGDAWVVFTASGNDSEEIYFQIPTRASIDIEAFSYSCYSYAYAGTGSLDYYDGSSWVVLDSFTTSYPPTWKNGSYPISSSANETYLELRQTCTGGTFPESRIFYLEIEWCTMTIPNSYNATEITATSGDDDYSDSNSLDSVYWETGDEEEANFEVSGTVESFAYQCYGKEIDSFSTLLEYYNGTEWITLETFTTSFVWYNDTVEGLELSSPVQLRINTDGADTTIQVDFMAISNIWYSPNHYAESFTDVSDWAQTVGGTWGTDSDVAYFDVAKDAAYDYYYSNVPEITNGLNYYYEIRAKNNISESYKTNIIVKWWSADGATGSFANSQNLGTSSSWQTFKGIINSDHAIESVQFLFYVAVTASGPNRFYIDYLRISPANESGWQHDGSTTQGISGTATYSTDGDKLNISAIGTTQYIDVVMDTTTTATAISTPYYPFLSFSITDIEDNDANNEVWLVRCYDTGSTHLVDYGSYSDLTGIFRMNLRASTLNDLAIVRFYCRSGDSYTIDFTKAYSIANFTVTKGSSTAVSDILYCDSGILHSSITSGANRYFVIDHDPTLSITESIWNVSTSTVDPELWFYDYVGGWSAPTVDETSGFLTSGTVTDFKLLLDATITIFTISFLSPLPDWHEAGEAVIIFAVLFDEWALDMGLIFLGLFLIPASTIYMAKGGLKEASMTKVFFALVAFILGWAFFIGGIM